MSWISFQMYEVCMARISYWLHYSETCVKRTPYYRQCLLLLVRTRSAHHPRHGLSVTRAGLTMTQSTTQPSTQLKWKPNFPTVTKSSLMNLYLNQEHQNSSILLTTNCERLPAEKMAVIFWKLYWNPLVNMYLHMAQCARKTSARYANVLLTGKVTGKNVTGTVKVLFKKDQWL